MTAPAGVSSGAAPEPGAQATPDPQAAGTQTTEPTLGATAPAPALGAMVPPQATEPVLEAGEPTIAAAEPTRATAEPAGGPGGGNAAGAPDSGPEPASVEPYGPTGRRRGVRLLAVAATVVGILALVGAAVAVLAVLTHGFKPKTVVTYRVAAVFSLRPGECINSSPNGLSVTLLSCAVPHDAEVFATFGLTGTSWPGSTAVRAEASSGCTSRVASYVNPQLANAGFNQEYVFPDQQAWQAGVRTVICEISAASGQLTGSVRQPG
jgi:Septum formation